MVMRKLGSFIFVTIILLLIFISVENVHAATGSVAIYYNDINQHPVGKGVEYTTCTVGTTYSKSAPSISGYTYMPNESETSTYCDAEGTNIIAFVYQTKGNKKEGTVNVSCYDTKGNKLSKCTDGRSGTPGVEYYINPPTIEGYKFVRVEGPNNGKFKEGSINVKFIYESTGGNLVETKKEEKPTPEVKQETKKEEPVKTTQTSTGTVTTKKIVTQTNQVAKSNEKEEKEVAETEKIIENKDIQRNITIVDHTKNNTGKYIAIGSILSSIVLIGFVIKYSLFK
jgi:hypothetical protein